MSCLHRSLRSCHPSMRGREENQSRIHQSKRLRRVRVRLELSEGAAICRPVGGGEGCGVVVGSSARGAEGLLLRLFCSCVLQEGVFVCVWWGLRGGWSLSTQRPRDLRYKSENKGLTSADRRTSLLSCLQYPVLTKSSTMDLSSPVPERRLNVVLGRSLSLRVNTGDGYIVAFQHGF